MKTFSTYVLLCRDGTYYTGVTSMLERRIAQHERGTFPKCYTFRRRPVKVVHVSQFSTAFEAIAAEKIVKQWTHAKKGALTRDDWNEIRRLSHDMPRLAHDRG